MLKMENFKVEIDSISNINLSNLTINFPHFCLIFRKKGEDVTVVITLYNCNICKPCKQSVSYFW